MPSGEGARPALRFGLQLPTFGATASGAAILDTARLAERLGFDSVWTSDHIVVPRFMGETYRVSYECVTTLAAVAAVTKRVAVGASVLIAPLREEILLAKQLATLDQLAAGRLIVGLAAGYVKEEFEALNSNFSTRGATLDRQIDSMRQVWRDGSGPTPTDRPAIDSYCQPQPVRGRLPIWIGGTSEAAIRRAAAAGDCWHPGALSPDAVAAGRHLLLSFAGQRQVTVAVKLRAEFPGAGGVEIQGPPPNFHLSHDLRGAEPAMLEELAAYAAAGVEEAVLFVYHADQSELREHLHRFAERVIPHARSLATSNSD
jgi:probable F420-dependent oxidoreductase